MGGGRACSKEQSVTATITTKTWGVRTRAGIPHCFLALVALLGATAQGPRCPGAILSSENGDGGWRPHVPHGACPWRSQPGSQAGPWSLGRRGRKSRFKDMPSSMDSGHRGAGGVGMEPPRP